MKKKIVVLSDKVAKELGTYPNQSEIVRKALDVYMSNISPEMLNGMRMTFKKIESRLGSIEDAVEVIAASVTIDKHSEWGAWASLVLLNPS